MARYKPIDTSPRFIAVDLERQLPPGTFEHELDLSGFDAHYRNGQTGAAPLYRVASVWTAGLGNVLTRSCRLASTDFYMNRGRRCFKET
ncbi:MAG: hypothetical protein I8H82_06440 [Rhodocyclales bacterium]|jgi:hypothetical protein|nr:hypothetical protein [Rhodocyclales bacterium]MBH1976089.1 hypothetical protein [Rhodocyclales bacterium]